MESYTKLNDSIYFHDASDLYVNLYLSSKLDWRTKWFSLTQSANVPLSNKVAFTIDSAPSTAFGVKFRVPYWVPAGSAVTVTLNGQCLNATNGDGYISVNRVWAAGDKLELTFPAEVQVSRLPDNKNAVAFSYGPVVLSAGLGTQSMVSTGYLASKQATLPSGVTLRDYIKINTGTTVEDWLKNIKSNLVQTAGKLEFKLKNTDADSALTFTPQYQRYTDRYGIYFKLQGTQGSPAATGGSSSVGITPCTGSGGASSTGGTSSTGGASSTAGTGNSGGSTSSGVGTSSGGYGSGTPATVGGNGTAIAGAGGAKATAGTGAAIAGAGGAKATAGTGAAGLGGANGTGAPSSTSITTDDENAAPGGCSCTVGAPSRATPMVGLLAALGLLVSRRGRRGVLSRRSAGREHLSDL
jgi:MYXO-CTERM domain-containing protein